MYSMLAVAHPRKELETIPLLTHSEAVAGLAKLVIAMTAIDREIERCTDPRVESCLQTLRLEHEVEYLTTLYGWIYERSETSLIQ